MTTPSLDAITDDIRQVMEVLRNQPETGQQTDERGRPVTYLGGAPRIPGFNFASEVVKETQRYLSADITKRLDLLQADLESLMAVDMDAVIERVVKARNAVLVRLCR